MEDQVFIFALGYPNPAKSFVIGHHEDSLTLATFSSSSVINRMPIEKSVLKNVVILLLEKVKASHVSIVQLLAVLINLSFTQVSQGKVFSRESFRVALNSRTIWHFVFDFFLSVLKQIGIFTMPFTEMENVRFTALSP